MRCHGKRVAKFEQNDCFAVNWRMVTTVRIWPIPDRQAIASVDAQTRVQTDCQDRLPIARFFWRRGERFAANLIGEARLQGRAFRRHLHGVVPRMRKVDRDFRLDPPGPRRHHDNAAGDEDRLLDVMRDKEHGLALRLPNTEQQFLGIVRERAIAVRCCIPPESNFG